MNKNNLAKYIVVVVLCTILGFYSSYNKFMGSTLVLLQVICLLFMMLRGKFKKYYIYYIIFTSSSIEISYSLDDCILYNFRNLDFFGVSISLIFAIFGFIYLIFIRQKSRIMFPRKNHFFIFNIILLVFGSFIGIFNIFSGIYYLKFFVCDLYYGIYIFINLYMVQYLLEKDKEFTEEVKDVILSIIAGSVISSLITIPLDIDTFYYGGVKILPFTQALLLSPFLLLFYNYRSKRINKFFVIVGLSGIILNIFYNASGKSILNIIIVILTLLVITFKVNKKKFLILMVLILIVFLPIIDIASDILKDNVLFISKWNQVTNLFINGLSIKKLPSSPKYRVIEFLNINNEFIEKPIYFFVGKGYGGSFNDYYNFIEIGNLAAYSQAEFNIGKFFNPHEAINVILLKNGYLGIILVLLLIIKYINKIKYSSFIFIGLYWVTVLYGFSNIYALIGIITFSIGIKDLENTKHLKGVD